MGCCVVTMPQPSISAVWLCSQEPPYNLIQPAESRAWCGAGTTGAGLAAGCPTMTVPFFGDQAFWGEMCRRAGVGPAPVAIEHLTQQRLLEGLKMLLQPEVSALL